MAECQQLVAAKHSFATQSSSDEDETKTGLYEADSPAKGKSLFFHDSPTGITDGPVNTDATRMTDLPSNVAAPPKDEFVMGALPKSVVPRDLQRGQIAIQQDGQAKGLGLPPATSQQGTAAPSTRRQRVRSPSAERPLAARMVTVPAEYFLNTTPTRPGRSISDAVIAPKPFLGRSSEDAESWLNYFERYAGFRQLTREDSYELFGMLMHEGAGDWLATLPDYDRRSFGSLKEAFIANYCRSPELKWKEAGDLFNQTQGPSERVEDFVTRMRKVARRLDITPDTLHYAVINGLRPELRLAVVSKGVTNLESSISTAKLAESAAITNADAVSRLLLDAMKSNALAAEKQAAEIRSLTSQVAAMSAARLDAGGPRMASLPATTARDGRPFQAPRPLRPTPQNQQRMNYANTRPVGGPRSFTPARAPGNQQTPQAKPCGRCGLSHAEGKCRADGAECRQCGRMNHFARVCRSARPRQE